MKNKLDKLKQIKRINRHEQHFRRNSIQIHGTPIKQNEGIDDLAIKTFLKQEQIEVKEGNHTD